MWCAGWHLQILGLHVLFFCLGRLGYKQPPLSEFLASHISEINPGKNRNLVCWWMCRPTASKTVVATANQFTTAKC